MIYTIVGTMVVLTILVGELAFIGSLFILSYRLLFEDPN